MSVLSSLKILDFSTLLPGPFATMLMADLGAEVLRVEAPDRFDMVRSRPPFDDGVASGHAFLNRSKRSIGLNLKSPEAIEVVHKLIAEHDIVVEQFRPGVMKRLGLDYESLSKVQPSLIYLSLTGYGQTGPMRDRAGHDNNYLSIAGVMGHSGTKEHGPVPQGVQVADIGAGSSFAVIALLSAVVHRQQTGEGQFVDVSMFDGSVLWNGYAAAACLVSGETPDYGSMPLNGGSHYGYFKTSDGRFMSVGSLEPQFWKQFCETLGRPDLIDRRELPGPKMDAVVEEIRQLFAQKTQKEWNEIFSKVDCCVEPVLRLDETFAHPQTEARNMVVDVPKANGGVQRQVGSPFKFSKSEAVYTHIGCEMGEHTDATLESLGYSDTAIANLATSGALGEARRKGEAT